jgi:proteasome lid subunit RPN8/RPN11
MQMGMRCEISRDVLDGIRRAAAVAAPLEACGLLFGTGEAVTGWNAAANVADAPERRFEIDPAALFAALRAERAGGAKILGYWHSHPGGDAMPSPTDAALAAPDGKLWLIVAGGEVTAWRAGRGGRHGRFAPVTIA